tara:strand:+ start:930 stop:1865 length:936 start_codon:yes stop_codon:yes gene_type:complete
MICCKACDKEFESDGSLHKHLRVHKMRMAEYYQRYYPRFDLYDGSIIKFKSKQFYFESNFNGRLNLKRWIKEQSEEIAREYCVNFLEHRKETRNLKYTPTEVELRTIMSPPTLFMDNILNGYYKYSSKLGLINKFNSLPEKKIVRKSEDIDGEVIYIDTREQKPLKFELPMEIKTLNFGDYAFSNAEASGNTYIERKSVGDFIGTMSGGFDRFRKEIERAVEKDAYLIVMVEESLSNCLSFNYLPHVSKKIRATPEFVFHNVRKLIQEYSNLQFLFVKNRGESVRLIQRIFVCGGAHKKIDLQLAYDMKLL